MATVASFLFCQFLHDGIFNVFIRAMHGASKENLLVRSESNGCEFVG